MNIQDIIKDPDFIGLPMEEQRKVLSKTDKDFSLMFPAEQDKVLNAINVQSQGEIRKAPGKWLEPLRTTMELGGLAGGAALGGVPGAGLGYAAMKSAGQGIGELTGQIPTKDIGTKAQEFALDVPFGMASEAGGQLASKALGATLNGILSKLPLAGKGTSPQAKSLWDIARSENIFVLPPDVSGHMGQSKLFQGLAMLPTSARIMQEQGTKTITDYAKWSKRLKLRMAGKASPFETGQIVAEGADLTRMEAEDTMNQLYAVAMQEGKNVPVKFPNFAQRSNDIMTQGEYRLLPKEYRETVDNAMSIISQEENWPLTKANDLRAMIAQRASILASKDRPASRLLWKLHDALETDMEEAALSIGSDAHKAFVTARAFAAENVYQPYRTTGATGKKVLSMKPEQITRMMKTASGLKEIKEYLPNTYFEEAKQGLIAELFEDASKEIKVENSIVKYIDPSKLEAKLTDYKKEYLNELLSPSELSALQKYIKLGKNLNNADKLAGNPSGTAGAWYMGQLLVGGFGFAGGAATGGDIADRLTRGTIGAAAFLGMPYAMARLVTTQVGRNYLINGFSVSPEKIQGIIKPLAYWSTTKTRNRIKWLPMTEEKARADQP